MKSNAIVRYLYLGAGFLSVGMAVVGTVLPVIPTVPLVLLAGFFFSRSSERFDRWLVEHPIFGPIVRDWRAGLGFTARAKAIAAVAITVSFGVSLLVVVESTPGRIGMITLALAVITYVISRPTKPLAAEAE
ncbi:MAG: YbaN family protein [Acidimicrobiia bacterium]|nr:YbaN family protein [Acidimicrobiia bacterium]